MSYISVRGNLGLLHTQVYGLEAHEVDALARILKPSSKHEEINEISYYNPVMEVINKLEHSFGYKVVSCTNSQQNIGYKTIDLMLWTLLKENVNEPHPVNISYHR